MPVKCYLPKKGQFQSDMVVEFNYEDRDDPNHNHIKEYDKAPIVFKTPTKGNDIQLPLGAIVRAYVSIKVGQKIKLDSFEIINNQNDLEDSFSDKSLYSHELRVLICNKISSSLSILFSFVSNP